MSGAEKKKYLSKTKTKVKKIKITLSKFFNNLINSNCKKSFFYSITTLKRALEEHRNVDE